MALGKPNWSKAYPKLKFNCSLSLGGYWPLQPLGFKEISLSVN